MNIPLRFRFLLTLGLASSPLLVLAQSGVNVYDLNDLSAMRATGGAYRPISFQELNNRNRTVNGLPLPDWQPGVVQFADGTTSTTLRLRYDPATDELQASALPTTPQDYYQPPTEPRVYQPGPVKGFLLSQAAVVGAPAPSSADRAVTHFRAVALDANGFSHAFFEELTAPTATGVQLLARYTVRTEAAAYNAALNVGSRTATEKLDIIYYLLRPADRPRPVKLNRKALFNVLSGREAELEAYVRQQHLRLDQPADVARLVAFYNQPATQ